MKKYGIENMNNATVERLERENERIRRPYDYEEAVYDDAKAAIEELIEYGEISLSDYAGRPDDFQSDVYDRLWVDDGVTGNASSSYTCNTYRAEMYLAHNWDLLQEALAKFGQSGADFLSRGAEWCDVTIRCALLGNAVAQIVDDMDCAGAFDPADDSDALDLAAAASEVSEE